MIFRILGDRVVALVLATALSAALALPARAQSVWPRDDQERPAAEAAPPDAADAATGDAATADANDDDMKDIDVSKLDWSQLDVDASTLLDGKPVKSARLAVRGASNDAMTWSANNKPNGASAVSVKQSVSPFLDTRVGADMTVAQEPTTMSELLAEKSSNGGNIPQSGGTAWASISAPGPGSIWDKTAVEARLDPSQDQSKVGTSISKAVPLSERYSLTLQNGYNLIQQGIVPVPGFLPRPTRNYQTEQSAKLSNTDTGTSFVAGQSLSSNDDKWLRKVGAEQKLFGDVSISGAIGETAQGATDKSITAGFKKSW